VRLFTKHKGIGVAEHLVQQLRAGNYTGL